MATTDDNCTGRVGASVYMGGIVHAHGCAAFCQKQRCCSADASGAARHQRHLIAHQCCSMFLSTRYTLFAALLLQHAVVQRASHIQVSVQFHLSFSRKNILDSTIGNEPPYGDHYVNCDRYPRTDKGHHYRRSVKNRRYFALYVGAESISE